ncbi:MAG TPA: energy transducer TonB [Longimicrobiaceae bacterium]|nr:energy transducer TonB [Longimicrobiaceae bacterium]
MRILRLVPLLAAAALWLPARAAAQVTSAPGDSVPPPNVTVVEESQLTRKPELTNRQQVARAMQDYYPSALRDHGVSGQAEVTFLIDPTGVPRFVQVSNSSGNNELDDAAIRVLRRARFTPPRLNGAPVWVRVRLPVVFSLS